MLQYLDFLSITSENLRLLRRLSGLTQEEVAETLLLSRSAYAGTEQGRSCVGFYTAYLLSNIYEIPMEYFTDADLEMKLLVRRFSNNDPTL